MFCGDQFGVCECVYGWFDFWDQCYVFVVELWFVVIVVCCMWCEQVFGDLFVGVEYCVEGFVIMFCVMWQCDECFGVELVVQQECEIVL